MAVPPVPAAVAERTEVTTELECVVEYIHFIRDDGFTVLRAVPVRTAAETRAAEPRAAEARDAGFAAAGVELAGVRPGETLRLTGHWEETRRHGPRLAVAGCERLRPESVRAIRRYLASGLVRGIGPLLAQALTDRFGEQTLEVIEREPERLAEVYGIGRRRSRWIVDSWHAQAEIRQLMNALRGYGISPLLAERLHRDYGSSALETLTRYPYRLVGEVDGLDFATADRIARAGGQPLAGEERLEAAVWEVCASEGPRSGHCHLPAAQVVTEAAQLAEQPAELMRAALERLGTGKASPVVLESHPVSGEQVAAVRAANRAERRLAKDLAALAAAPSDLPRGVRRLVEDGAYGADLAEGQREAVRMALTHTLSVLTGGPGCGKSHTVRELVRVVRAGGGSVTLAAPTGKAARRLAEMTGAEAMTVHRLAADPHPGEDPPPPEAGGGALFAAAHSTMVHLIVVDEASMLDVYLAARLAARIPPGTHLLLVGDVDQLPSVGPGAVLADLLAVPGVARTTLTKVFRQAEQSTIIANAHLIRRGQLPQLKRSDFWFAELDDPERIAELVAEIATERLPRKQGVDPAQVQVLCPARRGSAGADQLSRMLQERLNPRAENEPEYWHGPRVFRVGDRVIATRNDYARGAHGVFNGTLGTVVDLDLKEAGLTVENEDGESVRYDLDDLDDLAHSYALTVHKAQGSEFAHVVAPLTMDAPRLLTRRLFYTLATRARQTVVLVGQPRALKHALEQDGPARATLLAHRLTTALAGKSI
ncbi:ATP-dependent RecD-like DNA helicase [Actinospica sp.]|uniref:SF1B family DNA helicase RecD2 n=1 Tax=Actinospica sp. TaxID=1872142 RepID=UPI002B7B4E1C|nr:ATP-dependent RecD-like DNA helicase [Actinospica sp.]HWG28055.1 ATP-dependent RecD-like DNA helicase [Actinospica sp.]